MLNVPEIDADAARLESAPTARLPDRLRRVGSGGIGLAILEWDAIPGARCIAVDHSRGGSLPAHVMQALPHRFARLVPIDRLQCRSPHSDSAMHERRSMAGHRAFHPHRTTGADRRADTRLLPTLTAHRRHNRVRLALPPT